MENCKPPASEFHSWDSKSNELVSLELSVDKNNIVEENYIEEDEIEEVEVDETQRLHLQKVSSLVQAAYQRVGRFNQHSSNLIFSNAASEGSFCASTQYRASSLPESLDGGKTEVEELKSLPASYETALRINQTLQRRFAATLVRLEKTLEENLLKQRQLKEEEDEHGFASYKDRDSDSRSRYFVRPSSFAVPYFKDRTGMPAPMNEDSKLKVDQGYLDLYYTKSRTWLTSEQNVLVKVVQKEWKEKLINDWKKSLQDAERKLKNPDLSDEEKSNLQEEIKTCHNHVTFFISVSAEKIDMPKNSQLDWDKVSAQAFDGYRTTEECQLLWENYLHPDINCEPWTEEEDIQIQHSVAKCSSGVYNWKEMANDLGTGRTDFQIMKRWVSFIKPTLHPARWTSEASKKLEDTINMLRVGSHIPWTQVTQHLVGYTKSQVQSRWRHINPDQSKGPFTSDEDFVLIKGLYKFGMNFDLIAHFMPGRTKLQVRDRFKRSILSGLTCKPWYWREDQKIMSNCSMTSQHWRRMMLLLPKRDSCEIRMRFHILHIWQTIYKQKTLPPPLFPLSLTKKAREIKNLREQISKLNPHVRIYLDSVESNQIDLEPTSVKPFEDRRAAIRKGKTPNTLARLVAAKADEVVKPKLIEKRGGSSGPRTSAWPDVALMEYFLPGRASVFNWSNFPSGPSMSKYFHQVSEALQLKINLPVPKIDISWLKKLGITSKDIHMVNEVALEHTHSPNLKEINCPACSNQNADIIPLMPPNLSTTGAFRSLLIHKQKLKEMASKEFLLFQVPHSQLHKLGTKPNTLNMKKKPEQVEISEETITNIFKAQNEEETQHGLESDSNEPSYGQIPKNERKAAAKAKIMNYVYSQGVSTKDQKPQNEVFELPSEMELTKMQVQSEIPNLRNMAPSGLTKEEIIANEDKLLFHRFLSLFFWPSLFTLRRPPVSKLHLSSEYVKELNYSKMDVPNSIFETEGDSKGKKKLPKLEIEEHEQFIQEMEEKSLVRKRKRKNPKKNVDQSIIDDEGEAEEKTMIKKSIIQLKRSLIMRKVWDGRRKGLVPPPNRSGKKPNAESKSLRISKRQLQHKQQTMECETYEDEDACSGQT